MINAALRLFGAALVTGIVLVAGAGPAAAHNALTASNPAKGAEIATGPEKVVLTFDQEVQAGFNTVQVIGPDGSSHWEGSPVTIENTSVVTPLNPLGPAGKYTIKYRILSADGHPVGDSFSFTLTQAGTGQPVTPAAQDGEAKPEESGKSGETPVWPWIVGAVVLLAGGVVLAMRLGRTVDE
ncbi:copper resistance protein CopC [Pseudonocardiaceae bacterium YIM PH 21723]|nr:copper resistance protein CopC [Pseudonocardiaceae bacterium YIM PH 21723]